MHRFVVLLALSTTVASFPATDVDALSLDERVACRRSIEQVLWAERSWPADNPGPKPELGEILTDARLRELVQRDLAVTAALEGTWGISMTAPQLQREIDRQAASTRAPEVLRALWRALGDDPELIAECLARPAVEADIARTRYAWDGAIHSELRRRAEADLERARGAGHLGAAGLDARDRRFRIGRPGGADPADEAPRIELRTLASWLGLDDVGSAAELTPGAIGPLQQDAERFFAVELVRASPDGPILTRIAEWAKPSFDTWLATRSGAASAPIPVEGDYRLPKVTGAGGGPDSWTPVRYLPRARAGHSAVWTGAEMIVYSRQNGHIYDPVTDRWRPMNQVDAPADGWEAVVWTGTELLVWGGGIFPDEFGGGGRYDPFTDSWQRISDTGAPARRTAHTAVWTGTEMIVWGGQGDFNLLDTGARYDPATDSWTATTTIGAPAARAAHHAVWTGSEMVVWGGSTLSGTTATGGRYDPVTDTWSATTTTGAPAPRLAADAVWTGAEMIVWGGCVNDICGFPPPDGARYDPVADSWSTVTTTNAPIGRWNHRTVWTGSEMMVWSGCVNHDCSTYTSSGGLYDPVTDSWTATDTAGDPGSRAQYSAVWSGSEVIVWGGCTSGECQLGLRDGGRYDPATDSWTPIAVGFPERRINHTIVWTGAEAIVWGGYNGFHLRNGGRYSPAIDDWLPMSPAPGGIAARMTHTAVWSGTEMIVFGGSSPGIGTTRTGARYDPTTDSWVETEYLTAPEPRLGHAATWTGSEMLVWGGCRFSGCSVVLDTGGRYDPATDSWQLTTATDAPTGRAFFPSAWTGSELIVWGGWDGAAATDGGGRYDPVTDTWQPVSAVGAPGARQSTPGVWTGSEMMFWGGAGDAGVLGDGGRYDPATDTWQLFGSGSPLADRFWHVAEWTGSRLFLWGGCDSAAGCWDHPPLADGALYDPAGDGWTTVSSFFSPPARMNGRSVWTGDEVLLWGGDDGIERDDGGRYTPGAGGHIFSDGFESGDLGAWTSSRGAGL